MCVIYKKDGCEYLAIRVRRALETGLGDQALEVRRQLLPESVHARALGSARNAGGREAIGRAAVGDASPAPLSGRAEGADGVLDAQVSGVAIARVPAGALSRGYRVARALCSVQAALTK